jgi:hypothetical protein
LADNTIEPGHGNSIAAWVTVVIILVACSLGTLFFFLENAPLVWASVALAAVGLIVGFTLKKAGYGVGGAKNTLH